jgi:hypothetical protein
MIPVLPQYITTTEDSSRKRRITHSAHNRRSRNLRNIARHVTVNGVKPCRHYFTKLSCPLQECSFSHDLETFLQQPHTYIPADCPFFKQLGYCPHGYLCLALPSHFNYHEQTLTYSTIFNHEPYQSNNYNPDLRIALRTKTYKFNKSDAL